MDAEGRHFVLYRSDDVASVDTVRILHDSMAVGAIGHGFVATDFERGPATKLIKPAAFISNSTKLSAPLLNTTILTGSFNCRSVMSSPNIMASPPSPENVTTWRPGCAAWIPMACGNALAMLHWRVRLSEGAEHDFVASVQWTPKAGTSCCIAVTMWRA